MVWTIRKTVKGGLNAESTNEGRVRLHELELMLDGEVV